MPTSLRFRLLALFAAVSAWGLVAVGGIVRVTESGLGCPDWPLCEGRAVPAGGQRDALIEFSHWATAAVVTALVVTVEVAPGIKLLRLGDSTAAPPARRSTSARARR